MLFGESLVRFFRQRVAFFVGDRERQRRAGAGKDEAALLGSAVDLLQQSVGLFLVGLVELPAPIRIAV